MVAPLTDLLRAKVKFVWYPHCEQAFFNVKALLCSTPVLLAPRLEQPFKLLVDASRIGAGGILLQTDGQGINRPVSFFSKKFNHYQINYSVVEREALVLILALWHFHVYFGNADSVFTDHNPSTFLNSFQNSNQTLMQWALYLQPYNLDICLMCLLPCSLQSAVPPLKMLLGPKAADLDAELRTD